MWDEDLARKPPEEARYAKALKKVYCQLAGQVMEIPAGAKVRIVERIDEIQMYRVKYNNRVGLFMMKEFQPIAEQAPSLMPSSIKMAGLPPRAELTMSHDTQTVLQSQKQQSKSDKDKIT